MSNLAMAAHHHHKHHHHAGGLKLPHLKMPNLSNLVAIAHGSQGPTARDALLAGLALAALLIILAVRKMRRN